ncbi:hypothetical protein PHLCEN_2v3403 [Hermanssonia centrifuga]|uniref:Uncharacterized protein n=1 Tax=Hermanssonia centrifuga TaxID=98765 RepID=A0A2R6QIS9_9APHY|nr:hypothetical protein PHLCEN_2v3403 [Hermanssonia centrifuga]
MNAESKTVTWQLSPTTTSEKANIVQMPGSLVILGCTRCLITVEFPAQTGVRRSEASAIVAPRLVLPSSLSRKD